MIMFTSNAAISKFINDRLNHVPDEDDDEEVADVRSVEFAKELRDFINKNECSHRTLQELVSQRETLSVEHRLRMDDLEQKIKQLRTQVS